MSTTIHGTITREGLLELDEMPALPPGRVQVILQPLPELPMDDPFWQRMQARWDQQEIEGRVPRSADEIDAEIRQARDAWEERSRQIDDR